jgi:hypothetical protein
VALARRYQKYPEALRLEIAKSGNPYLYPEYKVPRTTALYWINNLGGSGTKTVSTESLQERKIRHLEQDLAKEKALVSLIEKIKVLFPYSFKERRVPSKPLRRKIVAAIKAAVKFNKVCDCLKLIGLSKSTYSNWLSEFYLCEDSKGQCKQRKPHQLTHDEIEAMRKLITSKKYAHFSIQSLCLFAKRNGILFCSLDSWYKYKKLFGWVRVQKPKKENHAEDGIRAKAPNEIWHVDVTQVKIASGRVVYIQVVYDNYSRFVIAWKVTTEISALNTVALIAEAKRNALKLGINITPTVMSDAGSENNNHKVLNFLSSRNIKRLIARVDIHFSNSMVESLFRMLKSNFLSFKTLRSISDVERKVDFFFAQQNEVMPRQVFAGGTPQEMFLGEWSDRQVAELKLGLKAAAEKRIAEHKALSCHSCKGDFPKLDKTEASRGVPVNAIPFVLREC